MEGNVLRVSYGSTLGDCWRGHDSSNSTASSLMVPQSDDWQLVSRILMMNLLIKRLNLTIQPVFSNGWGTHLKNGTWIGVAGQVITGEADMSPCLLTPSQERWRELDWADRWDVNHIGFYVITARSIISSSSRRRSSTSGTVSRLLLPYQVLDVDVYILLAFLCVVVTRMGSYYGRLWTTISMVSSFLKQPISKPLIGTLYGSRRRIQWAAWLLLGTWLSIFYACCMIGELTISDSHRLDTWQKILCAASHNQVSLYKISGNAVGDLIATLIQILGFGELTLKEGHCAADFPSCIWELNRISRRSRQPVAILHATYRFHKLIYLLDSARLSTFGGQSIPHVFVSPPSQSIGMVLDGIVFNRAHGTKRIFNDLIRQIYDTGLMRYLDFKTEMNTCMALISGGFYRSGHVMGDAVQFSSGTLQRHQASSAAALVDQIDLEMLSDLFATFFAGLLLALSGELICWGLKFML